jgi:hypothetical protein
MTDPKAPRRDDNDARRDDDELELDTETVKDLDVSETQDQQIRGGCSGSGTLSLNL